MKYFSLSYMLSEKDYSDYEKIVFKGSVVISLKRMVIPLCIMIAVSLFMDVQFLIPAIVYFVISLIIPQILSREFSHKTRKNSNLLKRMMIVDFYDNHIVVSYEGNENIKSHSEKHYGFQMIQNILESRENIYFAFSDNSLLIIPKAVIDSERYTMISNLIENLFRHKYQRLEN